MSSLADSAGVSVERMDSVSCIELALEGERLCKTGDFKAGIAFFDAALKCGQPELKTVSAIYSQLGNAWFYLGDYRNALRFHKLDLNIAIGTSDRIGEAKASGNVGNVLKMLENYDQAIQFCSRHLEIARELNDKVGEGRALYNLGNIYHTKAKNLAQISNHQPGNLPENIKSCLENALKYYLETMNLSLKVGDETALGRTYGNIGNTHYLMGDFEQAVHYHYKRLSIAQKQSDKSAERRAHLNLGNANIFLGNFHKASEHYLKTLEFAEQMNDSISEAQTCFSLGNTYTLCGDLQLAHKYYLRHLEIAKERKDRIGESRAYWSLANTMQSLNHPDSALQYASKHMEISMEINDLTGQEQAAMSIAALRQILNEQSSSNEKIRQMITRPARTSMKQMELISLGQDSNKAKESTSGNQSRARSASVECISKSHEDFFDLVHKYQSKRMDDQRCAISVSLSNKENKQPNNALQKSANISSGADDAGSSKSKQTKPSEDDFFDLLAGMQERRMNDQRATLPQALPHTQMNGFISGQKSTNPSSTNTRPTAQRQFSLNVFNTLQPDEDFFEQIIKCQSNRLEDQRSNFPPLNKKDGSNSSTLDAGRSIARPESASSTQSNSPIFAPTVPKEDFFDLIFQAQSKNRLDDQRSVLPSSKK